MGGRLRARLGASASALTTVGANRQLRRAMASFAAALTADLTLTVTLGVVAFRAGGAATLGIVAFLRMLPAAVLAPWGSALADRFRRERVLRWTGLVHGALLATAALVLALDGPVSIVYALAIAATGVFATYRPAHSALLPQLCATPLELTSAYLARVFVTALAALVGPAVAAVLLGVVDPAAAFAVAAALALVAGWCLVGLSYEAPTASDRPPLRFADVVAGYRALATYRGARLLAGLAMIQTFTRGCLSVLALVIAIDLLDGGEADVGVLGAATGVGAIVGALLIVAMRGRRGLAGLEGTGVALWGLPLVAIGAAPSWPVALVAVAVIGIGDALVDVGLFTLPTRLVPDHLLARWFGALESMVALTIAVGALVVAPLIDALGARWTLAAVGLLGPVAALIASSRLRRIDASVTVRDDAIAALQRVDMLRPLPMPAIESLAASARRSTVVAGETVFAFGDLGDRFYVIDDGEAVVQRPNGSTRALGPTDCFGEIALLRDVPRTAAVVARTDLELRSIDRQHFLLTVGGYGSSAGAANRLADARLAADEP